MNPSESDNTLEPQPPGSWQAADDTQTARLGYTAQISQSRRPRNAYRPHPRAHPRASGSSSKSHRLSRDDLIAIADNTLRALDAGFYMLPDSRVRYDIGAKIESTNERTVYISPDDVEITRWATAAVDALPNGRATRIAIRQCSTLTGARVVHGMLRDHPEVEARTIGVLNFASAKKPGGGFANGAQAQEESLARTSTLFPSLVTDVATQFYEHYVQDPDNPYYTHAMVYSPDVVFMKNDKGEWKKPFEADVLTSAAVNAGEIRQKLHREEDMRLLRERVRAAAAARAERQRQSEQKRKQTFAEARAKAAETRRKAEEEKKKAAQEKTSPLEEGDKKETKKEGRDSSAQTDTMEVDEANSAEPPDVQMDAPPDEQDNPNETTLQQVSKLDTTNPSPLPSSAQPESRTPTRSPAPADIPFPETPSPDIEMMLALAEIEINREMHERIARLLYLFYTRGARHLILGSFGTGVFQNSVETIAGMFLNLLATPGGKYCNVFESLVFAIVDEPTVKTFRKAFKDAGVRMTEIDDEAVEETEGDNDVEVQDGKGDDPVDGRREDTPLEPADEAVGVSTAPTHDMTGPVNESSARSSQDELLRQDTQEEQTEVATGGKTSVAETHASSKPVIDSANEENHSIDPMPTPAPI